MADPEKNYKNEADYPPSDEIQRDNGRLSLRGLTFSEQLSIREHLPRSGGSNCVPVVVYDEYGTPHEIEICIPKDNGGHDRR